MSYDTDIDNIVLFVFDTSQEIAHFLRGDHWKEKTYESWENEGFELIRNFLLEDIPHTQLKARMSAITSTKLKVMGQAHLYENHKKAAPEAKEAFAVINNLLSWKGFQEECLYKENIIMDAMERSLSDANKIVRVAKIGR